MYAVAPGDDYATFISNVSFIVNVFVIGAISLLIFIEVGISDDVDLVQGDTKIPHGVYVVLLAILLISSFIWIMSEWYLRRWSKYKTRHNLGWFYFDNHPLSLKYTITLHLSSHRL